MYKYVHKLLPAELNSWFAFVKYSHSYNTRAAFSNYLTLPLPKFNLLKRNLPYAGPKLWNSIPKEHKAVNNLYTFKQSFKPYILNNKINELVPSGYVDFCLCNVFLFSLIIFKFIVIYV